VHVTGTELARIRPLGWNWNSRDGKPLPFDEARTRYVFIDEPFIARPESQERIVMRPSPVGFALDTVHSNRVPLANLGASLGQEPRGWAPTILLSPVTGEFIAGPFPAGWEKLNFVLFSSAGGFVVPVEIDPGKEQQDRLDIDVDKYLAEAQETTEITGTPNAYLGMGGISTQTTGAQRLVGQVLLSDGKTPALSAAVLYFRPGSSSPPILAITDALGTLHARGLWRSQASSSSDAVPLQSPVVLALLPGECGATIYTGPIHRDKPLRLVLPPPISISGSITVGGKNLLSRPGVVHIVAEYQDKGILNAALSIETTADAKGNFVLSGLTPGSYDVQAALDDIWMSAVTTVRVANKKLRPIHIAIPPPGAPVQITLVDRDGKPDIGHAATLDRTGPLSHFWPEKLRSDGAGLIYIPTMESGSHILHVDGVAKPVKIRVPPVPAAPVTVRVQSGR